MKSLNSIEKNLILDLYFGCGSDQDKVLAGELIASNPDAAELYDQIEQNFDILGHIKNQQLRCPEHLFENTIIKLKQSSSIVNHKLTELLEYERQKTASQQRGFWKRTIDLSAVAASILIVASVYFPTVNNMRYKSWISSCKNNMASIAGAVTNYANDNQGKVPAVVMQADSPWWKVGDQGNENQSNTRHLWKLVKEKYIQPGAFVCQGRSNNRPVRLDSQNISELKDFPDKRYITYSLQLINGNSIPNLNGRKFILISDANPVFERIMTDNTDKCKEFRPVDLCRKLRQNNSINHNNKGQNVMFSDGSVNYITVRFTNADSQDDIFTLSGRQSYKGTENSDHNADIFLVP